MRVRITLRDMDQSPQEIVERLTADGPGKMTEAQIASALTDDGVPITQPTIHRIKHGASTSFEIGCALVRLAHSRTKLKITGRSAAMAGS